MNEQIQQISDTAGAMVELWYITYQQFLNHGFSEDDALKHTAALFKATFGGMQK